MVIVANVHRRWLYYIFLTGAFSLLLGVVSTLPVEARDAASDWGLQDRDRGGISEVTGLTSVYLPLVEKPDMFNVDTVPIWTHNHLPASHEVALFRRTFELHEPLEDALLNIFADTRYELWVDGSWIGRGPARFSRDYHEYDSYPLGNLPPGDHLIAVLVQWAPNNRRAESVSPILQAILTGKIDQKFIQLLATDETWRVMRSDAWNADAVPVHTWELIGPTELVDLRRLPIDWFTLSFDDTAWSYAAQADLLPVYTPLLVPYLATKSQIGEYEPWGRSIQHSNTSKPLYTPRSIAPLVDVEMPVTLVEQGILSPGRSLVELSGDESSVAMSFDVTQPIVFSVEMLSGTNITLPGRLMLDNTDMVLIPVNGERPDVVIASRLIASGKHTLQIGEIPLDGLTLSVQTENVMFQQPIPFEQGNHAGRRLLLAEPISATVTAQNTYSTAISLHFDTFPAYAVLDMSRTIHGRAILQVNGPAGTIVDLGWDERLYPETSRPLPFPGSLHPYWNQVDSWILDGDSRSLTTIDTRAGRYLLLAVWEADAPVDISLQVMEERYPVVQHGFFDSSDPLLNRIWQVGVDTLYPNMTDAYTDTPWRERGQWWGDAFVIDKVNRVAFGDFVLLRRGLLYMADAFDYGKPEALAPNGEGANMADYGMLWVHNLQEYLQLNDDRAFARDLYPTLLEFMLYLENIENPSTGLLDFPDDIWARTVYIDTMAWMVRKGQSAPANAMYIETLLRAASIAGFLGDSWQAAKWQNQAEQKKTLFNDLLYLLQQERYLTSVYQGQPITPTVFSQAWPLAYNLVDSNKSAGVIGSLQMMLSEEPASANIGTYGMYWVFDAYFQHGYVSDAVDLMKNYYGWMLSQGASTWWETFCSVEHYSSSLSHGWGSSPTWFLSTYVLGAQQTGTRSWQVKPSFAGVDAVAGAIPLPDGLLTVSWAGQHCQSRTLDIQSPDATEGDVIISDVQEASIFWNGQIVWLDGVTQQEGVTLINEDVHIPVQGGVHYFEITGYCVDQ
ncbi:MAG: alpha-L-rhamnosidase [Chloroflexi bacterium]|nr:alpha-L-rhamnosidase [Chloroflexota bacterium]MBU1662482.1 alpha-L-rhamnosidase [Chloroflexota bacterium]